MEARKLWFWCAGCVIALLLATSDFCYEGGDHKIAILATFAFSVFASFVFYVRFPIKVRTITIRVPVFAITIVASTAVAVAFFLSSLSTELASIFTILTSFAIGIFAACFSDKNFNTSFSRLCACFCVEAATIEFTLYHARNFVVAECLALVGIVWMWFVLFLSIRWEHHNVPKLASENEQMIDEESL